MKLLLTQCLLHNNNSRLDRLICSYKSNLFLPPNSFRQTKTWHGTRRRRFWQWVAAEARRPVKGYISITGCSTNADGQLPREQSRRVKVTDVRECDQNVTGGRRDPDGPLDAVHRKHQEGGRGRGPGYYGGTVRHRSRSGRSFKVISTGYVSGPPVQMQFWLTMMEKI